MDLNIVDRNGNVTVDKLLTHGKNYFDMAALKPGFLLSSGAVTNAGSSSITLTDGNYIYNATGTSNLIGFHYEDYIAVRPESKYTFSRDWAVPLSRTVTFYYYDADKSLISSSSSSADAIIQLTTPANCKYMRMSCNNIYGYPFTIGNTMVEIGHYNSSAYGNPPIATTYEAYVSYTDYSLEYQEAAPNIYDTVFDEILEQQTGFSAASTLKAMFETNNEAANYLTWNNVAPSGSTLRIDGEELIVKSAADKKDIFIYPGINLDTDDVFYVRAEVKRLNEEINAFFAVTNGGATQIATLQDALSDDLDVYNVLGGKITGGAVPNNFLRFDHKSSITGEFESAWKNFVVLNLTDNFMTSYTEEHLEELYTTYRKYKYPNLLTGSEIITDYIGRKIYIDYDNDIAHNLTTIYVAGNEPSLETHEALIPQYTNTVLKAKAFANTLQQEFMQISLDTPVYEGLSLRDIFESEEISATGKNLFDGIFEVGTISSTTGQNATSATSRRSVNYIRVLSNTAYVLKHFNAQRGFSYNWYDSNHNFISASAFGSPESWSQTSPVNAKYLRITIPIVTETEFIVQLEQGTTATTYENYLDLVMILETPSLYGTVDLVHWETGSLFTTAPSQLQLDEWLDMYLTLKGSTTNTGTEFYQDRFYIDYNNAKVYDYEIIEPYVSSTPADKEAFMAQVIAHTVTVTGIPEKMWIERDRVVILGSYTIIGE